MAEVFWKVRILEHTRGIDISFLFSGFPVCKHILPSVWVHSFKACSTYMYRASCTLRTSRQPVGTVFHSSFGNEVGISRFWSVGQRCFFSSSDECNADYEWLGRIDNKIQFDTFLVMKSMKNQEKYSFSKQFRKFNAMLKLKHSSTRWLQTLSCDTFQETWIGSRVQNIPQELASDSMWKEIIQCALYYTPGKKSWRWMHHMIEYAIFRCPFSWNYSVWFWCVAWCSTQIDVSHDRICNDRIEILFQDPGIGFRTSRKYL